MAFLRPSFLQGFVLVIGGAAFAFFGCLGAIAGMSSTSSQMGSLALLGGLGFVVGVLAVLVGGLLLVIATFKAIFGSRDAANPAPPANPS
jgi:hypothetical protein